MALLCEERWLCRRCACALPCCRGPSRDIEREWSRNAIASLLRPARRRVRLMRRDRQDSGTQSAQPRTPLSRRSGRFGGWSYPTHTATHSPLSTAHSTYSTNQPWRHGHPVRYRLPTAHIHRVQNLLSASLYSRLSACLRSTLNLTSSVAASLPALSLRTDPLPLTPLISDTPSTASLRSRSPQPCRSLFPPLSTPARHGRCRL